MYLAQNLIETGALDGMSWSLAQLRVEIVRAAQDGRLLLVVAVLILLWMFIRPRRRSS